MPQTCRRARCLHGAGKQKDIAVANLNPQKFCFHGQHAKPRATFRILPGAKLTRAVCAECYEKIMVDLKQKKNALPR